MQKKTIINDSELPIMKVLWQQDGLALPEILAQLKGNKSTLKTLLGRLVSRGAVRAEEITQRSYRYFAAVSEEEYIAGQRRHFLQKVFDGSAEKMLLNFVREENISPEDLQSLLDQIAEEGQK
ncbi:MAG: BlaI/MecI/CopY family transcriptional regulator [Firmicutes bacterium]|nr:BlaI/MecI/CopY family transcriptional regulator [Bacillota bacterium]